MTRTALLRTLEYGICDPLNRHSRLASLLQVGPTTYCGGYPPETAGASSSTTQLAYPASASEGDADTDTDTSSDSYNTKLPDEGNSQMSQAQVAGASICNIDSTGDMAALHQQAR